jgi:hypothetical protein
MANATLPDGVRIARGACNDNHRRTLAPRVTETLSSGNDLNTRGH